MSPLSLDEAVFTGSLDGNIALNEAGIDSAPSETGIRRVGAPSVQGTG